MIMKMGNASINGSIFFFIQNLKNEESFSSIELFSNIEQLNQCQIVVCEFKQWYLVFGIRFVYSISFWKLTSATEMWLSLIKELLIHLNCRLMLNNLFSIVWFPSKSEISRFFPQSANVSERTYLNFHI